MIAENGLGAVSRSSRTGAPQRVVVVGAGFAGYFAARRLARGLAPDEARVTVVSDGDGLLYQPLLPEIAVGALDPRAVVVPLASTLPGVQLIRGHASGIDIAARTVHVTTGGRPRQVVYDRLVIAAGAVTRMFDIPGLAERALGFKTVGEALYLHDLVLRRMQQADAEPDPDSRRRMLSFVVAGAGYAGTELVAQLARMTTRLLPLFTTVRADDLRWTLVDVADAIMPELGPDLGSRALTVLRGRGVDVRLGVSISELDGEGAVLTDGTRIEGATVVWCAGVTPSPLVVSTGLPTTKGRLAVDADLRVRGRDEVYAVGDAAAVPDLAKETDDTRGKVPLCPPTAQHAMRQGRAVARNVIADIRDQPRRDYRHRDLGLVVDLGGADAVARPLGVPLNGRLAKVITRMYHLYALPTGRRRTHAAVGWLLAGRVPDDVALGLLAERAALAAREHAD